MTVLRLASILVMICSGMARPGRKSLVWTQQVKEGEVGQDGDSSSGHSWFSTQAASL